MLRPVLVLVALVPLCACEPTQPDHGTWREDAYYAVSDVGSAVATAYLVVRQLERDDIAGNYAQVALVTAEETAGKKTERFTAEQPPESDSDRFSKVSDALSNAGDLLTDTRMAVVRRNAAAYPSLEQQLKKQQDTLDQLGSALGGVRG